MMRKLLAMIASSVAIAPAIATQKITCPAEISSAQISIASPEGWSGYILPERNFKLQAAAVFLGPLKLAGVLQGKMIRKKDAYINVFSHLNEDAGSQLDKWIICNYGDDLVQAYKLPITTDNCTITYTRDKKTATGYFVSDITCR